MNHLARLGQVLAVLACVIASASGCTAQESAEGQSVVTATASSIEPSSKEVFLPPEGGRFDYQIGGAYPPSDSIDILGRDYSGNPVSGRYNICYVNAFQAQPGDDQTWVAKNEDLILRGADGEPVIDEIWAEPLLDTSTPAKRARIAGIVGGWINECADKRFDAVEPDNLDSWTRSGGRLTESDNVGLATLLIDRAHQQGLAIAQKNTAELGLRGREIGFDFVIAEECGETGECEDYAGVYGRQVIDIEYTDTGSEAFSKACAEFGETFSIILRDRDVVPADDPDYVFKTC